jgi:hypothetical protein
VIILQKSPIQLGSINLQDFEIPQTLRFGGRHRLTVHSLANGRRIVERLGPDDDEIRFQGSFSGPTAEGRARAVDNLRLSGEIVWLTWESFRRLTIVKSFTADYHSPWWIPYQVSCVVVHQTRIVSSQGPSLAGLISADLSRALSAAAGSTISLTSLQTSLSAANALTTGTADQTNAVATIGSTLAAIKNQIDQQSATLVTAIPAGTDPADMAQLFASIVNSAASLAAVANVGSYVGRIGANVAGMR